MKSNLLKKVLVGTTLTLAITLTPIGTSIPHNVLTTNPFTVAFANDESILNLKFDNNTDDSSSNPLATKMYGDPQFTKGRIGEAIQFTTKGQYIDLGDQNELLFGDTQDFSIAFWIKSDKINGDPPVISNKSWNSGSNTGWMIGVNSGGNLVWNYKTANSSRVDMTIPNVIDSQWHHIVVSHDRDGNAQFFKDGQLVQTVDISSMTGTLDSSFSTKIGQDGTGVYGSTLTAQIDELQVFHKPLTESEVRSIYDNAPPLPPVAVKSISLDQTELDLKNGATMPLTVTIAPLDATDKEMEWSSSDEAVATIEMINDRPTVIAKTSGQATITAKNSSSGKDATVNVNVTNSMDVNGDGLITKEDIVAVQKNFNSREGDKHWKKAKHADLNGDKVVDQRDRKLLEEKADPYLKNFLYERVVFIGIDGAGIGVKDAQANATNIQKIMAEGASTYEAKAMLPTISGQNWGSMHHGVIPSKHGLNNENLERPYPENNAYPSYMKLLKQERPMLQQASFTTWGPINNGIIEDSAGAYKVNGSNDTITTQNTINYIQTEGLNSRHIFVHLDEVDGAGHNYGYDSAQWYEALQQADQQVGQIVQALEDEGLMEDTLFIVTTDHGGDGTNHGGNTTQERDIFWTAKGGSIKPGTVLSDVENMDTAAVIAHALRLNIPENWDAKIPTELFSNKK